MGIIDSISAGYRFLGRRVELILIPVLLDLLLWLSPQISITPILDRVANAYTQMASAAGMPAGLEELTATTTEMFSVMGESTNLLSGLVNGSLLSVPTIAGALTPPMTRDPILLSNSLVALGLWLVITLAGLLLGVLYMELLARVLPLGAADKSDSAGTLLRNTVRHWGRVVLFSLLMIAILLIAIVPLSAVLSIFLMLAPALGTSLVAIAGGIFFVVMVYLYFVTAAIVLDDAKVLEAAGRSIQLVRRNFLPVIGFVVLVTLIGLGMGLLLANVAMSSPFVAVLAIVLNAWIGTGLTMALLVFYRSRVLMGAQPQPAADATLR